MKVLMLITRMKIVTVVAKQTYLLQSMEDHFPVSFVIVKGVFLKIYGIFFTATTMSLTSSTCPSSCPQGNKNIRKQILSLVREKQWRCATLQKRFQTMNLINC